MRPASVGRRPLPLWALLAEQVAFGIGSALLVRTLTVQAPALRGSVWRDGPRWFTVESGAWLLGTGLAFLVALPLLRWTGDRWTARDFGLRRDGWGPAVAGGAALLGLMLTVSHAAFLVLPDVMANAWAAYGVAVGPDLVAFLLFAVPLGAAFAEEALYRGYLHGSLARWHPAWGTLAAAVAFAAAHRFQGWVPVLTFHLPGAVLFGVFYQRHRNLPVLMAVHLLFDLAVFGALALVHLDPAYHPTVDSIGLSAGLALLLMGRAALGGLWQDAGNLLRGAGTRWIAGPLLVAAVVGLAEGVELLRQQAPAWPPRALGIALAVWAAGVTVSRRAPRRSPARPGSARRAPRGRGPGPG